MLDGVVIVISPLIALMKDQVDGLQKKHISAIAFNSTLWYGEKQALLSQLAKQDGDKKWGIKFLYISPERLQDSEFLDVISKVPIALVAVDEVHCVSQWGHDFRPSYLKIQWFLSFLREKKHIPFVGLTATATLEVRKDIHTQLGITDLTEVISWFERKNLLLISREMSKTDEKLAKVLEIIQKTPPFWIVYTSSVKSASEVYQFLLDQKVRVWIYTWSMQWEIKKREQNNFMNGAYDVMVSTNAFGMGIDKKDIRFVIHYNMPGSIENYYQEVGRAGRDGKNSYWVALWSKKDLKIQEYFIETSYLSQKDLLSLYDAIYSGLSVGKWVGTFREYILWDLLQKSEIESEGKLKGGLKILEKYHIIKQTYTTQEKKIFSLELLLPKYPLAQVPIDWEYQEKLKKEAFLKLEWIKRLFLANRCKQKYILEYFWEKKEVWYRCGMCDRCLEKKTDT